MTQTSFGKNATEQFRRTLMGRFVSRRRRRIRSLVVASTVPSVLLVTLVLNSQGQNQTTQPRSKLTAAQKAQIPELKNVSVNIRRVSEILNAEGVQIEAGLLFTPNGRKKARPQLEAYPDMYLSKTHTGPLRGVLMAENLTLSEKLKVEGDTVIIAKHLIFKGRAPLIKGPHDVHLFVLDSAKTNGPGTVITIDTSGLGRKEWLESQRQQAIAPLKRRQQLANHVGAPYQGSNGMDGAMGSVGASGSNGNHGTAGSNGSCSALKNGSHGTVGSAGTPGGNGGNGHDGTAGGSSGNQTITITNINAGAFAVTVKGGAGGAGGPGGFGGIGGTGGNGGSGGNGANCNCAAGGVGTGGNGGNAGAGGNGGSGGRGGNGANGGNGGNVVVNFPWGYDFTQVSINNQGGAAGPPGPGGQASVGGAAGSPGLGGHGGSVFGCDPANDGTAGNPASGGAGGSGGNPGSAGQPGNPGSTTWNMTGGPDESGGSGSEKYGWEPGATYGSCTEWFLVSFHCEMLLNSLPPRANRTFTNHAKYFPPIFSKWSCVETGRMYIGCY